VKILSKEHSDLDKAIARTFGLMADCDPGSEEFGEHLTTLERLTKLKGNPPSRLSRDVMVTVAANLLGILIIVGYEHGHVLASKGLNFVTKTKPS